MAKTPEAKVKDKVKKQLKEMGAYYFMPIGGPYAAAGVPDIVGCYESIFFGIECKAGNNKPTVLQQKNLDNIEQNGGIALVINEQNVQDVTSLLKRGIG